MKELKSDVIELKRDVLNLKERVVTLEKGMITLKDDMEIMKGEIGTLKKDMVTLKSELKGDMALLREQLYSMQLTLETEIRHDTKATAEAHTVLERHLIEAIQRGDTQEKITIRVGCLESEVREIKRAIS